MIRSELEAAIRRLMWSELFGVLATSAVDGPHSTIVAFAVADDLHSIVFATARGTRKFENLARSARVSLFVDNRQNDAASLHETYGIEARGTAVEVSGTERGTYEDLYCARHPWLAEFVGGSAIVRITVDRYDVVHKFQEVLVLDLSEGRTPGIAGTTE